MQGYQRVLDELETQGLLVSSYYGENQMAHCPGPSHSGGDQRPSLSVKEGDDGRALLFCHAGCTLTEVVNALGLTMSDLFEDSIDDSRIVAEYVYTDAEGQPLYRVKRSANKDFFQERVTPNGWKPGLKDTQRVLYGLPSVIKALENNVPIYRVEGEKDVHTIMACETGVVATTNSGGTKAWRPEYSELLRQAKELYIVADMDKPGIEWAKVIQSQTGGTILYPPVGKDATDALLKGYHLSDFLLEPPFDDDWDDWQNAEHAEILWLFDDVFAAGTLVWCYGPKETAKSFYLLSVASALSHRGYKSTFYSEEMPYNLDVDRIQRFGPDPEYFHWKNGRGLDLMNEESVDRVIQENQGSAFIIFDSYERVWGGRANENRRAAEFAAVCKHIIVETGATVAVIDHTGYPEKDESGKAHSPRRARGASAKEQQADMSILFESRGEWRGRGHDYFFRITNMKPGRLGNVFTRDLILRDTADGGIAVVTPDAPRDILGIVPKVEEKPMTEPILEFQGKYRFLSNFYPQKVLYDSQWYPSSEHAFQAAKTLNEAERDKIAHAATSGEAKRMGRSVKLRSDWESIKLDVMETILRSKFLGDGTDTELWDKLVATGDAKLVEGNTWGDTYWGVCNGDGANNLGKILMKIRNVGAGPGPVEFEHVPPSFKEQRAKRRLERAHRLARIPKTGSREQAAKLAEKHAEPKEPRTKDTRAEISMDELREQM